jgi:glycosyltransferase involved in cell wall biosynthesis
MSSHRDCRKPVPVALLGSRGIPARYGGFETVVETLAVNLPKDRFRVTVFCESALRRTRPKVPGVSLVYFPVFEKLRIVSEAFYDVVGLAWAALASVEAVILFGYTASLFCLLPRLFGKTVLVNVDGLEWKRSKFPRPIRSLLRLAELIVTMTASLIICDSYAIQEYYRRTYEANSEYVPNPVSNTDTPSLDRLAQFGLQPESYYLVVARLEPENHIDMIVEGFLESGTTRKLVIVGPLINTRYVKRLLEMRTDHILFLNGVYDRALLNSLRVGSFAYIHGHEVGGTNPSLLESMISASPIIAFDVPFNREVAGDSGVYFKNSSELSQRIVRAERDPEWRRLSGRRANAIASSSYSAELAVSSYARVIDAALNQGSKSL